MKNFNKGKRNKMMADMIKLNHFFDALILVDALDTQYFSKDSKDYLKGYFIEKFDQCLYDLMFIEYDNLYRGKKNG